MELPLGGPALRHYTPSRPRPHRQKLNYRPCRPQETIIESENEVLEHMGRVDEGVEEFFTKRVLPNETPIKQDEEPVITQHEVTPASSEPCPPPTKTLRRKLGDFFTLKKKRGLKSEASQEGRPKKASIADLIRPLREAARSEKDKDKDRGKEHDKENEKAKAHIGTDKAESVLPGTHVADDAPLRGEAVPPRRALREGKSQSLILLSGSAAAGATNVRNTSKKQLEGQHSFEQKLHLMLQRIGVAKPPPGETQTQEGEMKKAESEGTIIDNKPEPPSTFSKPRTMSASSDTRHQIRASVSAHEAAGKPPLLPKPVVKSGQHPSTSGRNTPENELSQIKEAETNTPTTLSATAAPSPQPASSVPVAAELTATTSSPSAPVPDSATAAVCSSGSVSPAESKITVSTTAAAAAPAGGTVGDGGPPVLAATAASLTPVEPAVTTALTAESAAPAAPVPSTPEASDASSVPPQENASVPFQQSPVRTSTEQTEATSLEEKGAQFSGAILGEAAVSLSATPPSSSTSRSDPHPAPGSGTEAGEAASAASGTPLSPDTKTASHPSSSSHTVPAAVQSTTLSPVVSTPHSAATSCSSAAEGITSPARTDLTKMVSPAISLQPSTLSSAGIPAPPTCSSDTSQTDTTSTASSLNSAETTSTSSPAFGVTVSSLHTPGPDHPPVEPSNDASRAASHYSTNPPTSEAAQCQDGNLPVTHEQIKHNEAEKTTKQETTGEDGELKMADISTARELRGKNETECYEKTNESDSDKPAPDNRDVTRKEAKEERGKAVEETTLLEPVFGEELAGSGEDTSAAGPRQDDTTTLAEK